MGEAQERYEHAFEVRMGDLDLNRHLTSPKYLEYAIHTRFAAMGELGVLRLLEAAKQAPVVFRDELEYRRELRAMDRVTVSIELAALSGDASRWRLRHEFVRSDGVLSARIRTDGAWLDLRTRKLVVPSAELAEGFARLHHTEDFESLG
jgi:acyl-CoA thioester hydrolase